jgi:hypothetical protein
MGRDIWPGSLLGRPPTFASRSGASRVTSDAGLLLPGELERLGLNTLSNGLSLIADPRTGPAIPPTRSIPPAHRYPFGAL